MFHRFRQSIVSLAFFLLLAAAPAPKATFSTGIRDEIKKSLDDLQSSGDFSAAENKLQQLFDQAVAYALTKDIDALRESDFALRLVRQLKSAPQSSRIELLKYL